LSGRHPADVKSGVNIKIIIFESFEKLQNLPIGTKRTYLAHQWSSIDPVAAAAQV